MLLVLCVRCMVLLHVEMEASGDGGVRRCRREEMEMEASGVGDGGVMEMEIDGGYLFI